MTRSLSKVLVRSHAKWGKGQNVSCLLIALLFFFTVHVPPSQLHTYLNMTFVPSSVVYTFWVEILNIACTVRPDYLKLGHTRSVFSLRNTAPFMSVRASCACMASAKDFPFVICLFPFINIMPRSRNTLISILPRQNFSWLMTLNPDSH